MFEQDYVMRLIKEMVRAVLKLLFNIDTDSPSTEIIKNEEERITLEKLLNMVDEGKINEAENQLSDLLDDKSNNGVEIAILFYSYLNDKTEDFLEIHDFTRDEVKEGLKHVLNNYGLGGITQSFFS